MDLRRVADMLGRIQGRIVHKQLARVSPLAVPVLLEIGKVSVDGSAVDELLDAAARAIIDEAIGVSGDPAGAA
jgi:ATP-dependent Lhr-like helicase